MNTKRNIWLVTSVSGLLVFSLQIIGDEDPLQQLTPEAAVEHLISLRHGLSFLDDENQALLDRVRNNPDRYANALTTVLSKKLDEQMLVSLEKVHRLARAIDLARQIGHRHAQRALHQLFR